MSISKAFRAGLTALTANLPQKPAPARNPREGKRRCACASWRTTRPQRVGALDQQGRLRTAILTERNLRVLRWYALVQLTRRRAHLRGDRQ
jgi:hypothetical protein